MFTYKQSQKGNYTYKRDGETDYYETGYYDKFGEWFPECRLKGKGKAVKRVKELNK